MTSPQATSAERLRRHGQSGAIAPALMLFMFAVAAGGFFFLRQAQASSMTAEADTAADAAALAGADVVRDLDVISIALMMAYDRVEPGLEGQARAAAVDYARRNDATLQSSRMWKVPGEEVVRFEATVRGDVELDGRAPERTSTAEIEWVALDERGSCMSRAAVAGLVSSNGMSDHPGPSGLSACSGDTENLDPEFKVAILRVEASLGEPIRIVSGYRGIFEQAELYRDFLDGGGRAAPPGQSYHQYGRAIDVGGFYTTLGPHLQDDPDPVLGWPEISDDLNHFQDERGRGGPLDLTDLVEFDGTRLIATP